MAKGWKSFGTINALEPVGYTPRESDRAFKRLMAKTATKDVKELKEDAKLHYEQKIMADNALLDAFENNRLKSKDAIKRAMALKKEREIAKQKKENAVSA